jgi:hypothetical protein
VDGGFFDNSGTATVMDVLEALNSAAEKGQVAEQIAPIILIIRNDPERWHTLPRSPGGFGSPISVLDAYRSERSNEFTKALCQRVRTSRNGRTIVAIRPKSEEIEFPLGWTLSEQERAAMDMQLQAIGPDGGLADVFRAFAGEFERLAQTDERACEAAYL